MNTVYEKCSDVTPRDRTLSLGEAVTLAKQLGITSFSVEIDANYIDAEPGQHRYNVVARSGHTTIKTDVPTPFGFDR